MNIHDLAERTGSGPLTRTETGSILVAVDGSQAGWDALAWAGAEADARSTDLRITHACSPPTSPDPFGHAPTGVEPSASATASAADRVMDEAIRRAHLLRPAVPVSTTVIGGPPAIAVPQEGCDDALIVVGRHRRPGRALPWAWPTSWKIAEHAGCPVVVVDSSDQDRHGPSSGRVVACLGGRADPPSILGFALRAALRWGVGVTALHVEPENGGAAADPYDYFAEPRVDDALRTAQDAFPDVNIRHRAVTASIARGLLAESVATALLVLGPSLRPAPLSRVVRTFHRAARGAVAVVGARDARATG